MEPPFRVVVRQLMNYLPVSAKTRALWEASARPAYLLGLVTAADQARKQGISEIAAIEFGVAGGHGLLALEREAAAVERETSVRIKVYGFDMGPQGLPTFIGDYRDHPDLWQPGDYPMNEELLRSKLTSRTTLILGNVGETVPLFFQQHQPPTIGFVSFDLDLYSSTRDALRVLTRPESKLLWHVPLYFDDIEFLANHRGAGELLAIREFNETNSAILIDRWYGVKFNRPFPERPFLEKMYVAHDLTTISKAAPQRPRAQLPLAH
jgi:hypothetical protein